MGSVFKVADAAVLVRVLLVVRGTPDTCVHCEVRTLGVDVFVAAAGDIDEAASTVADFSPAAPEAGVGFLS